jgi:hypothetical protein
MITRIISGGQTGADQGGLRAGVHLGLTTGGKAPKGWVTESGPQKELLKAYGLTESRWLGYPMRTAENVQDSNGTIIFGQLNSQGSRLTSQKCQEYQRPCMHLDVPFIMQARKSFFLAWLKTYNIHTLNVAGNRESVNPGIEEAVFKFLVETLNIEGV